MSAQIKIFNSWYTWSESFNEVYAFLSTYGKDYFSKFETGDYTVSDSDSTVNGKYIDCYAKDKSGTDKRLIRFSFGGKEKLVWLYNTSDSANSDYTFGGSGRANDSIGFGNKIYYKAVGMTDNGFLIWANADAYWIISKTQEELTCVSGIIASSGYPARFVNYVGRDSMSWTSASASDLTTTSRYREIGTYGYSSGMTVLCPIVVVNTYLPHVFDVRYTNMSLPVGAPSIISIKGTEYIFTGAHAFN